MKNLNQPDHLDTSFEEQKKRKNDPLRQNIFLCLVIIIAAQVNVTLLLTDFRISIAAICFPVFLLLVDDFSYYAVSMCAAIGVLLSRIISYWMENGALRGSLKSSSPEVLFYLSYSFFVWLYLTYRNKTSAMSALELFPIMIIDYGSNFLELFNRVGMDALSFETQLSIFFVAWFRTLIVWVILTAFEKYKFFLLKKEHEERYRHLLLLTSKLNDEVVWMRKNTSLIEETMSTAYQLYENLQKKEENSKSAKNALKIASDIHEIKKEYLLIMRGISDVMEEEDAGGGMYLSEIIRLLKDTMTNAAKEQGKTLELQVHCEDELYTTKHYYLMSIFRNLLTNALEASKGPAVQLKFTEKREDNDYRFDVTDYGSGIPAEDQEEIFKAGYSTKINYETGEVNRGLGLNFVKNLTEKQLYGTIRFRSEPGNTTFSIWISKHQFEDEKNEHSKHEHLFVG
jgi:two-component system sensor histidine kinase YcbA